MDQNRIKIGSKMGQNGSKEVKMGQNRVKIGSNESKGVKMGQNGSK